MKTFLFAILALLPFTGFTQEKTAAADKSGREYRVSGTIGVESVSDLAWIRRYDNEIEALKRRDDQVRDFDCDVLFLGSSSITLWDSLEEDMKPLRVVNRGYGGATLRDLFYNYRAVLSAYRPRAIAFYCDNDLAGDPRDLGPGAAFDHYRLFLERLNRDYPRIPVYVLAIKYSLSRHTMQEQQQMLNKLMKEYAATNPFVIFVDVCTPLLDGDGDVRDELFRPDHLHLNADGYGIWTSILKPLLLEKCK